MNIISISERESHRKICEFTEKYRKIDNFTEKILENKTKNLKTNFKIIKNILFEYSILFFKYSILYSHEIKKN